MTHAINRTDTITREWMVQNHIHCHDPLTNLLSNAPTRSIRPPLAWLNTRVMWRVIAGEAILTALALVGWLIWRMM